MEQILKDAGEMLSQENSMDSERGQQSSHSQKFLKEMKA